ARNRFRICYPRAAKIGRRASHSLDGDRSSDAGWRKPRPYTIYTIPSLAAFLCYGTPMLWHAGDGELLAFVGGAGAELQLLVHLVAHILQPGREWRLAAQDGVDHVAVDRFGVEGGVRPEVPAVRLLEHVGKDLDVLRRLAGRCALEEARPGRLERRHEELGVAHVVLRLVLAHPDDELGGGVGHLG